MGTNTLTEVISGNPAAPSDINDIVDALKGHHVPRRTDTGAADTAKNYDLGTLAYQWRNLFLNNLYINNKLIDFDNIGQDSNNSVQSGATRSNSIMADFIRADGTDLEATILATATPLAITANNISVSVTADITLSGITAAPSSNNTCLVNGSYSGHSSKIQGERGTHIGIDNIGTEISDRVGEFAAFKVNDDIFIGLIESDKISSCRRGFFFDENGDPIDRDTIANNDTITLLSLGWVFLQSDGATTDITYKSPSWTHAEPSSPDTDDYWYDQSNEVWKRYDGASFVTVDRTLIGWVVADTTSCIASRSIDFKRAYDPHINLEIERVDNTKVQTKQGNVFLSVYANPVGFDWQRVTWDITTDLESGLTEASSTNYYVYITEQGDTIISDKQPYDRRIDLRGWYHPHESWRYCGTFFNNGSSNISTAGSNNAGAGGLVATEVFSSSGTFTKSDYPNMRYIVVTCIGGGGGGARGGGGGGGGGGCSIKKIDANDLTESITVTRGGGGSGGTNGSSGGTSSFGSYCSASGGAGGAFSASSSDVGLGGRGGSGSGGDVNFRGSYGGSGINTGANSHGSGGNSFMGGGGRANPNDNQNGTSGDLYGGGGGAIRSTSLTYTPGSGANGVVIVEVYE